MKRLIEDDATDFERMLLDSIELDVAPEGAEAALLDRLDAAPVVDIATTRKKLRTSTYLLLVAATIGILVILLARKRHDEGIVPIVQEEPRPTPVSSDVPAMQMPLPLPAPAPAPIGTLSAVVKPPPPTRPAPSASVVVRRPPPPALSTLLAQAAASSSSSSVTQSFDKGTAAWSLGRVNIDECRQVAGPSGAGHVVVVFAPAGNVQHVTIDPPFEGTFRGMCVAAKFGAVTVPPFQGSPVRVGKSFVLQ